MMKKYICSWYAILLFCNVSIVYSSQEKYKDPFIDSLSGPLKKVCSGSLLHQAILQNQDQSSPTSFLQNKAQSSSTSCESQSVVNPSNKPTAKRNNNVRDNNESRSKKQKTDPVVSQSRLTDAELIKLLIEQKNFMTTLALSNKILQEEINVHKIFIRDLILVNDKLLDRVDQLENNARLGHRS